LDNVKIEALVRGKIDNLAFGGEGILRHQNLVIFVPFAAPEDVVSCRLVKIKKNYAEASIEEVLEKSPFRREPACKYFGICGGCQLQHLKYEEQLKVKQQWIKDAFQRIGKCENVNVLKVIPSKNEYVYRRHVSLTIKNLKKSCVAGYVGANPKTFVEVDECPIFIQRQDPLLKDLQAFVHSFEMEDDSAKVTILKDGNDKYILHFHFKHLPKNSRSIMQNVSNYKNFAALTLSSPRSTLTSGKKINTLEFEGLFFDFSSDVFMQNNPEQSINIYRKILSIAKESAPKKILDLYCGIGISSLILAKTGFSVTGIEYNGQSIKMANLNARKNNISNVKFIEGSVEDILEKEEIPDFVIINPPREGLDPKVIDLLKLKLPEKIVYISCMPSTLARDINLLGKENYTIDECQPYDMFPQTTHVETLVTLRKINR